MKTPPLSLGTLVPLSSLPRGLWLGRPVFHPLEQVGNVPNWSEYDVGVVYEVDGDDVRFVSANGGSFRYFAEFCWTPGQRLYHELTEFYDLVDPVADHEDEAHFYANAMLRGLSQTRNLRLLELGCGAGNNAFHYQTYFTSTLVDASERMLALSRQKNPSCEHLLGDMRSVRLGREFDAVFVHDAIMYMTSEADLKALFHTAALHTRSQGVALFAPDCTRETFREGTELLQGASGTRALRGTMWTTDPDPADDTYVVDFTLTLKDGDDIRVAHDRHMEGLFSQATWIRLLEEAGFAVTPIDFEESGTIIPVFLCVKA